MMLPPKSCFGKRQVKTRVSLRGAIFRGRVSVWRCIMRVGAK
jgi:hypothetical protein